MPCAVYMWRPALPSLHHDVPLLLLLLPPRTATYLASLALGTYLL